MVAVRSNAPASVGKIAVVYARYSSHSQGEQSIEGQLAAAKTYAEARGYTIIQEYIDRAQSGRTDNRDEFQRMLSDATRRKFDVIIVWKVDRFGRNREEITFNKHHCKQHGVRVEYVAENLPDSPESVILESVLEGMAEYYSLQLSQNIRRGYYENAKKGKYCGGKIPFGYALDDEKRFIIDPKTAPIAKHIFEQYAAGYTTADIIRELNAQGIRTGTGGEFNKSSLRKMLSNEKYIGNIVFRGGEVRAEGVVPPIIDKETFARVQEQLVVYHRTPAYRWNYADYILSGKLYCGLCGHPMAGESGISKTKAKHAYYACMGRKRFKSCTLKAIRKDLIEPYILRYVTSLLSDQELMDYLVDATWNYYCSQNTAQDKIIALKHQLADVEKGIANLIRAIEMGIFNAATKSRMDELDAQRTALTAAIASAELESSLRLTRNHIQFFLEQMRDNAASDIDTQRRLIKTFINAIFVYPDKIIIAFNYSGENERTIPIKELSGITEDAEFGCRALCSTRVRVYELFFVGSVFAIKINKPVR